MKKYFLLAIFPLFSISCKKDNGCGYTEANVTATGNKIAYLQNYITTNSITATQHSSGIFYTIINNGAGASPTVCSNVTVHYTGWLLSNGNVFDQNTTTTGASWVLGQLIAGWQKGLPL